MEYVMLPKKLYKYRSLSGDCFKFTQSIFLRSEIYFPSRKELNDPFEGLFKIEIPGLPETIIPIETSILSLSSNRDNALMWSHYADSHKGICLEFDTRIPNSPFAMSQPVNYKIKFDDYCFDANFNAAQVYESVSLTKSKHWKYEKEWRVIGNASGACKFPPESLTGVIAGCNIPPADYDWLVNLLTQRKEPTKLYRAIQNKDSFSLRIIEVPLSSS